MCVFAYWCTILTDQIIAGGTHWGPVELYYRDFGNELLIEITCYLEGRVENKNHSNDMSIFHHWFKTGQDF